MKFFRVVRCVRGGEAGREGEEGLEAAAIIYFLSEMSVFLQEAHSSHIFN